MIKWVISPLQDCWDPEQGSPYHSGTVGAWGRVREGTWAFSPSHSSEDRFVKNYPEESGGTRVGGAPGEAHGPHTTKTMVRDNGRAGEPGEWPGSSFPQSPRASLYPTPAGVGGKALTMLFFSQYFSFLGTSQGKLSLPKWP